MKFIYVLTNEMGMNVMAVNTKEEAEEFTDKNKEWYWTPVIYYNEKTTKKETK